MRAVLAFALFVTCPGLAGCPAAPPPPPMPTPTAVPTTTATALLPPLLAEDPHSHAAPARARVRHVALDLTADFEARAILGTATLGIDRAPGAESLVLDARELAIEAVHDASGAELAFELG